MLQVNIRLIAHDVLIKRHIGLMKCQSKLSSGFERILVYVYDGLFFLQPYRILCLPNVIFLILDKWVNNRMTRHGM